MSRRVVDLDSSTAAKPATDAGACLPLHVGDADRCSADDACGLDPTESARQRVRHLFRHSLRCGEVNPLLHMLLRYRTGSTQ